MSFVLIVSLDLYLLSLDSFCLINCHEIEYFDNSYRNFISQQIATCPQSLCLLLSTT